MPFYSINSLMKMVNSREVGRVHFTKIDVAKLPLALLKCRLVGEGVHFFLTAFSAALVLTPATSFLVVALMTPTATVCLMSRTANRPRGGKSEKASTHIGLEGSKRTMPASPDFTALGLSSTFLPDLLSTFSLISLNLQAM